MLSAYARWTWPRCRERILSLKRRLGYDDRLWVLGFALLDDGRLVDPFHGIEVFDPGSAPPPAEVPVRHSAVPEMYCTLSTYAAAVEVPLSGEWLSLAEADRVRRPRLMAGDCAALLRYAEQDLVALRAARVPFFGAERELGDLAFEVWPLPRVPVRFVLWRGDDEVADGGTAFLDRTAAHYLPGLLEEWVGLTVWRLRNILDREVRWGYHDLANRAG